MNKKNRAYVLVEPDKRVLWNAPSDWNLFQFFSSLSLATHNLPIHVFMNQNELHQHYETTDNDINKESIESKWTHQQQ